jgi:glycosyltransferase involved in cell wall biosynthesis
VEDSFQKKPAIFKRLTKRIFEEAKSFISVSRFLAEGVKEMVVKKEYTVVPNVVDTTLFYYSEKKHPVFTFIHGSNMVPLKNVTGILLAMHQLINSNTINDVQCILIGNKDDQHEKEAEKLGLLNRSVFFKGEVPYEEVARQMQKAHCFILNSHIENSPCVIGEALCCGLPVIATRVGGVPELVDETNSVLIHPQSSGQLAEAMFTLYEQYANFNQEQIAHNAASRFSYAMVGKEFNAVYAES